MSRQLCGKAEGGDGVAGLQVARQVVLTARTRIVGALVVAVTARHGRPVAIRRLSIQALKERIGCTGPAGGRGLGTVRPVPIAIGVPVGLRHHGRVRIVTIRSACGRPAATGRDTIGAWGDGVRTCLTAGAHRRGAEHAIAVTVCKPVLQLGSAGVVGALIVARDAAVACSVTTVRSRIHGAGIGLTTDVQQGPARVWLVCAGVASQHHGLGAVHPIRHRWRRGIDGARFRATATTRADAGNGNQE